MVNGLRSFSEILDINLSTTNAPKKKCQITWTLDSVSTEKENKLHTPCNSYEKR